MCEEDALNNETVSLEKANRCYEWPESDGLLLKYYVGDDVLSMKLADEEVELTLLELDSLIESLNEARTILAEECPEEDEEDQINLF